jgi:integrase
MSFLIHKTGPTSWIVKKVVYKDGVACRKAIDKLAYAALGFNKSSMTVEQAKERASRLNLEKRVEKSHTTKVNAAERLKKIKDDNSIYMPAAICDEFEVYLDKNYISRQKFGEKLLSHWLRAQALIIELKLLPKDFAANKNSIVNRLRHYEYSIDYSKKLLRLISLWGEFYSEKQGQFYRPMAKLDSLDVQLITDAYTESDTFRGESEHITPDDLNVLKDKLPEDQYRWVYVSVWCGLRPSEINGLNSKATGYKIESAAGVDVLTVYQGKLVRAAKIKRWKRIPLFLKEQKVVIGYVEAGLKQPLIKYLKKYLNKKAGLYGGRKAFTDLMMNKGQSLEDISQWLGHTSIDRTWRSYKDKKIVRFTNVAKP